MRMALLANFYYRGRYEQQKQMRPLSPGFVAATDRDNEKGRTDASRCLLSRIVIRSKHAPGRRMIPNILAGLGFLTRLLIVIVLSVLLSLTILVAATVAYTGAIALLHFISR